MAEKTPDVSVLDDELVNLLKSTKKEPVEEPKPQSPVELPKPQLPAEPPIVQVAAPPVILLQAKPEPNLPKADLVKIEDGPQDDLNIKAILAKFGTSLDLILANHTQDRAQIETTIQFVDTQIKAAVTGDKKISPMFIDALVRLLQTKAEINTNATSVLDSITKLLSAGKKNELLVNIGAKGGDLDIMKLLSQPRRDDEGTIRK